MGPQRTNVACFAYNTAVHVTRGFVNEPQERMVSVVPSTTPAGFSFHHTHPLKWSRKCVPPMYTMHLACTMVLSPCVFSNTLHSQRSTPCVFSNTLHSQRSKGMFFAPPASVFDRLFSLPPPTTTFKPRRTEYECLEQGSVVLRREAALPEGTVPSRARFSQGDACSLDLETLGSFDAVLASNLLCRCVRNPSRVILMPIFYVAYTSGETT